MEPRVVFRRPSLVVVVKLGAAEISATTPVVVVPASCRYCRRGKTGLQIFLLVEIKKTSGPTDRRTADRGSTPTRGQTAVDLLLSSRPALLRHPTEIAPEIPRPLRKWVRQRQPTDPPGVSSRCWEAGVAIHCALCRRIPLADAEAAEASVLNIHAPPLPHPLSHPPVTRTGSSKKSAES